jgi:hypothetical protein
MIRRSSAKSAYKKTPVPAKCRKHPGVDAVKDGMCQSCLAYEGLGKQLAPKSPKEAEAK